MKIEPADPKLDFPLHKLPPGLYKIQLGELDAVPSYSKQGVYIHGTQEISVHVSPGGGVSIRVDDPSLVY